MIRLFFIEQDIARATNKQKFPMQTNTGHWTLLFEYIFRCEASLLVGVSVRPSVPSSFKILYYLNIDCANKY